MAHTFVGTIIHIYEQFFPVIRQCGSVHRISVILARDVALVCTHKPHGLIVTAVAVFQFVDSGAGGLGEELIAHTDTHDGANLRGREKLADVIYRHGTGLGIAWAVSQEQAVKVHLVEIIIPGDTDYLNASAYQAAQDIVFATS